MKPTAGPLLTIFIIMILAGIFTLKIGMDMGAMIAIENPDHACEKMWVYECKVTK